MSPPVCSPYRSAKRADLVSLSVKFTADLATNVGRSFNHTLDCTLTRNIEEAAARCLVLGLSERVIWVQALQGVTVTDRDYPIKIVTLIHGSIITDRYLSISYQITFNQLFTTIIRIEIRLKLVLNSQRGVKKPGMV